MSQPSGAPPGEGSARRGVTFAFGLFGTGKTYCASAALKALFVAEPNLPLQEFSRNVQSLLADAPEGPVPVRACLGGTMTKPQTWMSLMRLALNSSRTMSPAVASTLAPFSTKIGPVAPWPLFSGYPSYVCG